MMSGGMEGLVGERWGWGMGMGDMVVVVVMVVSRAMEDMGLDGMSLPLMRVRLLRVGTCLLLLGRVCEV